MICPRCGTQNPDSAAKCSRCGIGLALGGDTETFAGIVPSPIPNGAAAAPAPAPIAPKPSPSIADMVTAGPWAVAPAPGAAGDEVNFGPRYKIQRMLGEGGMGAVYKAHDVELDRTVALKLIRPGLAMDANVSARFKQELLLASKVSHKNILRIHDLGDANGVKFISMAYVEGQDLHQLLVDHGKLPVDRAIKLAKQMCSALEAAHAEGVVHRDFKPQNILLDKNEQVYVTDFGLAKSLETDAGLSRSGEFLGTPRYMAPEQVEGRGIDHRVDLYALGLILYEMLTGDVPFHADSTIQLMYKRVNELPKSPKELNPDLPDWLVRVVMKCLERNPEDRYQTAAELLSDLQQQLAPAKYKSGSIAFTIRRVEVEMPGAKLGLWIAIAIVVIAGAITFAVPSLRYRIFGTNTKVAYSGKPISVLVGDFTNHTGDPVLDSTLEPMMNVALEGANFINAYNRGTARRLAGKLPHPTDKLDEQSARLVAASQGIAAVITGEITLRGGRFNVSAIALDAITGNVISQSQVDVDKKDDIVRQIPKLVAPLRQALGDNTPESVQLEKAGGAFTASSLEAVHEYGVAMEQQFSGNREQALRSFSKVVELDPGFARAYAGIAGMAIWGGQLSTAENNMKLAMEHVDRMTDRERYRIRGQYYIAAGDWQKCIEQQSQLAQQYPGDNLAYLNLSGCYGPLREFSKALEAAKHAAAISPKAALLRSALSFDYSYVGDFPNGEREARESLKLNPAHDGYLALAESQLGQGNMNAASDTYHTLEKLSALGASTAAAGLGDVASYQGRFSEAAKILDEGAAADVVAKRPDNAAGKFALLAHVQLLQGQKPAALASADKALANSKSAKIRFLAALTFIDAGESAKAQKLATSLDAELVAEPQAYGKIVEGLLASKRGDAKTAIKSLTDANNLLNTWIGHFELGRAYLEAGLFVEADSEFDVCLKRRGEALELFLDNQPTNSYILEVYYYQGRAREGLKSSGFKDSYRSYLAIREPAGQDPRIADIRRRLGN